MRQSDAAARRLLVSLISLQTLELTKAAPCTETLSPFDAYNTVLVSLPSMKSPPVHSGFNRSAALEGFFPEVSAEKFECADSLTEFKANAVNGSPVTFYFGAESCPLSSVSLYKSNVASGVPEVGFRMDFDSCSAAVLVGVKKNPTPVSNMVPWMKHICQKPTTTTKQMDQTNIQVTKEIVTTPVGAGKCVGDLTANFSIDTVKDVDACKMVCQGEILENALAHPEDVCTGLAFNPDGGDQACLIYGSSVPTSAAAADGYKCFNMTERITGMATSTQPPLNQTQLALENQVPALSVTWGADTAILEEVGPADESQTCVMPFKYFTLQDSSSKPAMIPVDESQWDEMMGYIPEPQAPDCDCKGAITIDRVAFVSAGSQASLSKAWKAACPDPMALAAEEKKQEEESQDKPKEEKSKECTTVDSMISVFIGFSLPIVIWLIIGVVYFIAVEIPSSSSASTEANPYMARTEADFRSGAAEQSKLLPSGHSGTIRPNPCSATVFLIMIVVTIVGSLLLGWFGTEFLGIALSSIGCTPSFHDLLIIKIAGALSAMIAIILALNYMKEERYDRPKEENLVLGRMAEDGSRGELIDEKYYYHGLVTRIEGGADGRFRINN